jgi:hypothetical protein
VWGGTIDDAGTPWAADTIINVYSTTKTMSSRPSAESRSPRSLL